MIKMPLEVRDGNTKLKIYRGKSTKNGKKYPLFTLVYYEAGRRQRKAFGSLETAKNEAEKVAGRLEQGHRDVLRLTSADQHSFALATKELAPTGVPLLYAIRQYVAAVKVIPKGTSLLEAARDFAQRHPHNTPRKPISEVVDEFLKAKEQDGASDDYLRTLRYHLNPLKERFHTAVQDITAADLDAWIRSLGHSPRTRKKVLASLTTLFRFARSLGYLPKNVPTEADSVTRLKVRSGKIGIISPEELEKILRAADSDGRKVYFALGAFTGIRAAELSRLEWSDIDLKRRHVEIGAAKAKTATRRLVPICDALYAWLLPYTARRGRIFKSKRPAQHFVQWAGTIIGRWPSNALRHSFVSYRVAQTQNVAQTALEAGNSPAMIFANYRELVTKEAADKWFSVVPRSQSNNRNAEKEI